MKGFVLAVLVALVACTIGLPSVRQHTPTRRLGKFSFGSCLPKNQEEAVVKKLSFMPDPLVFPGPLNVTFNIDFKDTVDSPLKGEVYLARQVGTTWVKVPCVGQIGSCTYDDVCDILSQIGECPQQFIDANVPCMCPFKKGSYKLPTANFDVPIPGLPNGNYRGQLNLSMNNNTVGCYNMTVSFGS